MERILRQHYIAIMTRQDYWSRLIYKARATTPRYIVHPTSSCLSSRRVTMSKVYTAIPLDENGEVAPGPRRISSLRRIAMTALFVAIFAVASFILGFAVGQNWSRETAILVTAPPKPGVDGLMPPQAFIPESMEI
jgi:hypothetical protein